MSERTMVSFFSFQQHWESVKGLGESRGRCTTANCCCILPVRQADFLFAQMSIRWEKTLLENFSLDSTFILGTELCLLLM